ncbi:hypothetical protein SDC9_206088 [bioreactor metagenome]|uniref:Uncharacterized protein n=1 Tax=bioreactor metagenome TaxID=1076179 RepID=A0A645JFL3_9ZZZZ
MEQPQQGGSFQRPPDRDPLALELDRKDQGDKEQRYPAEPGQVSQSLRQISRELFEHNKQTDEREHCKCRWEQPHVVIGIDGADHPIDEQEVQRAGQCGGGPGYFLFLEMLHKEERIHRENPQEDQIPRQRLGVGCW